MKKVRKIIFFTALFVLIIVLAVVNIFYIKNDNFWEMSIGSCLTLLVALSVSYYFTQKNQD